MIHAQSFAKINWSLRITGKRADGYHDLETIFQTISLHDSMTFERADGVMLTCDDPSIPVDETNLVKRAARVLGVDGVRINLSKRIPAGGGLGGGSSNAATTLRVLDEMFGLRTSRERMHALALSLGSDVPFFLVGGTVYATGRGEVMTPLPAVRAVPLLLILPDVRVPTAEAFSRIRNYSAPLGIPQTDVLARPDLLNNDFEPPIFDRLPQLAGYKRALIDAGAFWAGMSGSGSTIVGAFRSRGERDRAATKIPGVKTAAAETIAPTPHGAVSA